ncbi:hypothetical protein GCM10027447_01380 [Glycomyces halotolerans]
MEPPVMSALPPYRSSRRPTGTEAAPQTSSATVMAPDAAATDSPSSARIGVRMTAKA